MSRTLENAIARSGAVGKSIRLIEYAGLVIVLIATLFAAGSELIKMFTVGAVGIGDLLLFMYLEMISMVETYWRMGKRIVSNSLRTAAGIWRGRISDSS